MSTDLLDFQHDVIALALSPKCNLDGLTVSLLGVCVATRSPDYVLDLLFAVGAEVFSKTLPYKDRSLMPRC